AAKARQIAEDGDFSTADEKLQEALLTSELAYGSSHPQVATIVLLLAEVMRMRGRGKAATVLFERAVGIYETLRLSNEEYVNALLLYAEHLRLAEEFEPALSVANRAVVESKRLD